jgi:polar amino acid transport system substrate-binding protein
VYADPEVYTKSFGSGEWDIAIGPRESSISGGLSVSPPFGYVENLFVVAPGRSIASASEVDRPGVRLIVTTDGAPDKFLTPRFKSAEFVRISANTESVTALFRSGKGDVYASNAQAVYAIVDAMPDAKVLPEAFTAVPMAVALQKGRSPEAVAKITAIIQDAIRTGVIQKAISAAGLRGVRAASN